MKNLGKLLEILEKSEKSCGISSEEKSEKPFDLLDALFRGRCAWPIKAYHNGYLANLRKHRFRNDGVFPFFISIIYSLVINNGFTTL